MNTFLLYLALQADGIICMFKLVFVFSVIALFAATACYNFGEDDEDMQKRAWKFVKASLLVSVICIIVVSLLPNTKSFLVLLNKDAANKENYQLIKQEIIETKTEDVK